MASQQREAELRFETAMVIELGELVLRHGSPQLKSCMSSFLGELQAALKTRQPSRSAARTKKNGDE